MTYNMAYGDDYFGIIPKESPIAWFFTVDAVDPVSYTHLDVYKRQSLNKKEVASLRVPEQSI